MGEGGHRGGVAPAGRGAKVSRERPAVQNDRNSREGAQGPVVKRRTARLEGAESWHGRGNPDQSVRVYCGSEGTPGVSRFLEQKRILFSKSCNRRPIWEAGRKGPLILQVFISSPVMVSRVQELLVHASFTELHTEAGPGTYPLSGWQELPLQVPVQIPLSGCLGSFAETVPRPPLARQGKEAVINY